MDEGVGSADGTDEAEVGLVVAAEWVEEEREGALGLLLEAEESGRVGREEAVGGKAAWAMLRDMVIEMNLNIEDGGEHCETMRRCTVC